MAEFPVTCSCGTEFVADDEAGPEIRCPTCGNQLHLDPEPQVPTEPSARPFFRCPRCERPVEHERIFACPRCGADLRPGPRAISDDTFRRLIDRELDVPPPPFYGRMAWILFRPRRFFRHIRFEEGFHSALLFFLLSWFAPTPLVAATWHIVSSGYSHRGHSRIAESAAVWTAKGAGVALPFFLVLVSLWAMFAHCIGRLLRYQGDLGAMLRVACYGAVPLPIGLTLACGLLIFEVGFSVFGLALPFLFWTLLLQVIGLVAVSRVAPETAWFIAIAASSLVAIFAAVVGSRLLEVCFAA